MRRQRCWFVDPLDGTKEFIKRNGDFTVNIALIDAGEPVLGVVYAPVLNVSYAGARGIGALRIQGTTREAIRTRGCADTPAFVVSRSHKDAALDVLLAKLPAHEAVSKGSSLKFCLVATGEADLYPRTGPTSEWDTAAGQCVAECAGAEVLTLPDLPRTMIVVGGGVIGLAAGDVGDVVDVHARLRGFPLGGTLALGLKLQRHPRRRTPFQNSVSDNGRTVPLSSSASRRTASFRMAPLPRSWTRGRPDVPRVPALQRCNAGRVR